MPARRYVRRSSEVAARFAFFDVERHTDVPEGEAGRERVAYTLKFADWVAVAAVTEDGRFVLVRQHRHGVGHETLETAGGIVDPGEAPAEAAARELREESGFAGASIEPLGFVHPNAAMQDNRCFLFLVRGAREVAPVETDEFESTEPVLLTRGELERALEEGSVSHVLSVVALERALARLR
ncbi:MAG TPA: NUDIX hydrolase [Minicystis sp.]|nr:NUDIX hydrolase [Minicystis sp.]